MDTEAAYSRALAAGGVSRVAPRTAILGQNPLIEVRIAFVTGPEGEVIEFLQSEQILHSQVRVRHESAKAVWLPEERAARATMARRS